MFVMVFTASKCMGQNGISGTVLHDVKLGLGSDKEHNNGKSIMDLIVNVSDVNSNLNNSTMSSNILLK